MPELKRRRPMNKKITEEEVNHAYEEVEDEEEEEEEPAPRKSRPVQTAKRKEPRANKNGHVVYPKNNVEIEGRLGADPDFNVTQSGTSYCKISVAVWAGYADKDRTKKRPPIWIRVTFWGDIAEMVADNFQKGDTIHVWGSLTQQKWNGKVYTEINSDYAEQVEWRGGI